MKKEKFERRDNKVSAKNQNAFKKEYSKNNNRKAHMGSLWGSEADEVLAKKGLGQHFLKKPNSPSKVKGKIPIFH